MTKWEALHGDGVSVVCPGCGHTATITETDGAATLLCGHCGLCRRKQLTKTFYSADGYCPNCAHRLYAGWHGDALRPPKTMNVECGRCGLLQALPVSAGGRVRADPLEGLAFAFSAVYRGHPIWAYNRAHLGQLLHALETHDRNAMVFLPLFLRLAKNRTGVLRLLRRMQEELLD